MPNEPVKANANSDAANDKSFSLVLGGPLYQLYLRSRLARPPLNLVHRRVIGFSLICWLPCLILALVEGHAYAGVSVPFLQDIGVHIRFLCALPLLIGAELIVHGRIRDIVQQFLDRGLIAPQDRARFDKIIASAMGLRNSILIELCLLTIAVGVGHWVVSGYLNLNGDAWNAVNHSGALHFTIAGYWYAFVSLPILRFIILRWYFRLFIWYWFLWHVRQLRLRLNLFHPDLCGGLGFLAESVLAFAPVLMAQTILLAGVIVQQIWFTGATLPHFKMEILGVVVFLILLVLAPLCFFMVQLGHARLEAKREYGILASHYVDDFRHKWIEHFGTEKEQLLGTGDIQSLADLGNAYGVVREMRIVPFGKDVVVSVVIIIVIPLLPLTLTMFPFEKIIEQLFKLVL